MNSPLRMELSHTEWHFVARENENLCLEITFSQSCTNLRNMSIFCVVFCLFLITEHFHFYGKWSAL